MKRLLPFFLFVCALLLLFVLRGLDSLRPLQARILNAELLNRALSESAAPCLPAPTGEAPGQVQPTYAMAQAMGCFRERDWENGYGWQRLVEASPQPISSLTWYLYGVGLEQAHRADLAIAAYQASLSQKGNWAKGQGAPWAAAVKISQLCYEAQDYTCALDTARLIRDFKPQNGYIYDSAGAWTYHYWAQSLEKLDDLNGAIEIYQAARGRYPLNSQLVEWFGERISYLRYMLSFRKN